MTLGSHIVRRGGAAVSVSGGLLSSPREPLLFLYPQWIRTSTTSLQDISIGSNQRAPSMGKNHVSSTVHVPNFKPVCENAAIKAENEKLPEKEYGSAFRMPEVLLQPDHPAQNGNDSTNSESQHALKNHGTSATDMQSEGNAGPFHSTAAVTRRILASERKRTIGRAYNKLVRENYEEKKEAERMDGVPNWREILHGLERHTPQGADYWHDNVLRIKIPFKAVRRLLFSEEDNIWAIKMRCGCLIEISEVDESIRGCRVVLLSGPVRNITRAAVEILRVVPGAVPDKEIRSRKATGFDTISKKKRSSLSAVGSLKGRVRFVRSDARERMARPIRADKVPRPAKLTPESFGLYVQHLTSIRMSNHMQKILYKPGENHVTAVVDILKALFLDPECRTAISAGAFNDALAYLVKKNAIHVVRDLFVHMEMQNLRMNTETFNIMLRGTAASRSIGNFHYIFWLMVRRGYSPNTDTWLAFMGAMEDHQIKAHILKAMKQKELVHDPRIQKGVCENFVEVEINSSLEKYMTHEQFLAHMADRYGQDWLTTASANRILDALGSKGLISRCWDFLKFMHSKDVKLSSVSVLTVLHHCEKQGNPQGAIEIIHRLSSLIGFEPSQEAYHSLFNIAWEARFLCVARVVWCYACLNAATTYVMRRRIIAGVQTPVSGSRQSSELKFRPRREWSATACRFILGIPIPSPHQQRGLVSEELGNNLHPLSNTAVSKAESITLSDDYIKSTEVDFGAPREYSNPAKENINSAEKYSSSENQCSKESVTIATLKEQLNAFRVWEPRRPFADVLAEAFEKDKDWTVSGANSEDERLERLTLRMPAMPLRRKSSRRRRPRDRKIALQGVHPLRKRVSMWKRVPPLIKA